jgi:hypothetical protein
VNEIKNKLLILSQAELQLAVAQFVLRREGIDPDSVAATTTIAFRSIDGVLLTSVFIESIVPHVAAPPSKS